ncbi:MAG: hypothetical protein K6U14_01265 [Firmicutes bacterium]|nr:hypothetical protein [Alicyclobacillaceae bacterium]MCL6496248.1 hypothetical protein [Bacillota bacterium]
MTRSPARRDWIRRVERGLLATGLYLLPFVWGRRLGLPPIHLAWWLGAWFPLPPRAAIALGWVAEGGLGYLAAFLYETLARFRPAPPLGQGLGFGAAWAVAVGAVGLPLFDRFSPLVQSGAILAPGPFGAAYGWGAALTWLAAALAMGTGLALAPSRGPDFPSVR